MRLEWQPGLSERQNAEDLYERFRARMEQQFPGCFKDGRVSHLGYVDGFSGERTVSRDVDDSFW